MNRLVKRGLLAATVLGSLTLGACVTDGYYSGSTGYSTYPYSRPYTYPSGSVSFYYSSPRYYRNYNRGYYPRRYHGGRYYRYNNRHYRHNSYYRHNNRYYRHGGKRYYHNKRPGNRPSHHGRPSRGRSHR